jgi:hypothetical protein
MTSYPYNLSITTSVSNRYGELQKGNTERICIVGFADCDSSYLNNPYVVYDLYDALATFSGSGTTAGSLRQGLLEAYYAGCRDIVLLPIGTMSEWQAFPATGSFYIDLSTRYSNILNVLRELDYIDIVVLYDANPLVDTSLSIFDTWTEQVYEDNLTHVYIPIPTGSLTLDLSSYDNPHMICIAGEGIFDIQQLGSYRSNLATTFAGLSSRLAPNVPPDNRTVSSIHYLITDYEGSESTLETNKIVGARKTVSYNRGYATLVSFTLCKTLASTTSDFTNLHTMRCIRKLMRAMYNLDIIGGRVITAQYKLQQLFSEWLKNKYLFSINATYDNTVPEELKIELTLGINSPYEQIVVDTKIGPVSSV